MGISCTLWYFNSQPHEEADAKNVERQSRTTHFNSQPHEEADRVQMIEYHAKYTFQLTASRRGWRDCGKKGRCDNDISTHSLTKRLTTADIEYLPEMENFNSQPHEEADQYASHHQLPPDISTHSLTKRLTGTSLRNYHTGLYFNSQPHEEADQVFPLDWQPRKAFQLTASRRGWLIALKRGEILNNFNSQPHEEADDVPAGGSVYGFTHFNSQPHEEADCKKGVTWKPSVISTHSLTKRLTVSLGLMSKSFTYFNSQPHEEADGNFAQKFLVQNCIFVTITYIVFSVHLLFDFLCIFSSWIYPFAGANTPEKVVCLTFALIISRYL